MGSVSTESFSSIVTTIGDGPFQYCSGLTNITTDASNPSYSSLDGVLFNKDQTLLLQYPGAKTGAYTIPNSVTTIGEDAFGFCQGPTSLIIPNSVTNIGNDAFANSFGLASVTIPNSVITIGESAFDNCHRLASVIIGSGVTNIGSSAFAECPLTSITVDALNPLYSSFNGVLFNKDKTTLLLYPVAKTGAYTIPNSVTTIGNGTFAGCSSLTSVTIGNSVTNIGGGAFVEYSRLSSVTIGNHVANIGDEAFEDCSSLKKVYFQGDAPLASNQIFDSTPTPATATVYYLPGTSGWASTFAGRPAAQWVLPTPLILTGNAGPGVRTNAFGFTISWAVNAVVVVEAGTDFADPVWNPVGTNLLVGGSSYFSDPEWKSDASRFYRLRQQ